MLSEQKNNYSFDVGGDHPFGQKQEPMSVIQAQRFSQIIGDMAMGSDGNRHSLRLAKSLLVQGFSLSSQKDMFRDEPLLQAANMLAENADEYRFQLGIMLAQIPFQQLPDNSTITYSSKQLKVQPFHPRFNWALCTDGEPRLDRAIAEEKAFVINDTLLLKGIRRPAALCLDSFSTDYGTCVAGGWYAFENEEEIIEQLTPVANQGKTRCNVETGTLIFLREVADDKPQKKNERLEKAQQFVQKLGESVKPWEWQPNRFPKLPVE